MSSRHPSSTAERRHQVLDPCTLGRPFHLLEDFNQRLGRQLDRHLAGRFNHRHGAGFVINHVAIGSYVAGQGDASWRTYITPAGTLSVRLERRLLLAMLGYHYGDKGAMKIDENSPEIETERRFGAATGLALLDVLRTCVMPSMDVGFVPEPLRMPAMSDRIIRIEMEERHLGIAGLLEIAVDDAWLGLIFAAAAPRRATATPVAKNETPLAERLPIRLSARMLTKEWLLDDVMRLAPGDVLPVRMPDTAEVMVGDTCLFHAAVAEHGGTLCLTSFENAE
ncbi:FliM/FliN family flagellar motor C-terminal domain-containing protein [Dyella sp. M7H15-1]|uniref:FliM/FliN family flagellar motor switch protein n=1 Tax=Dyella sp. M7H15-1 TaxID=2501295 RepID=UPI001F0CAE5F|nr:FliM/FliN family flagellar motor C-terminal domain-containing protein [Dyella sp. M7H15-1]